MTCSICGERPRYFVTWGWDYWHKFTGELACFQCTGWLSKFGIKPDSQ